jgi:hypothetical protein
MPGLGGGQGVGLLLFVFRSRSLGLKEIRPRFAAGRLEE